MLKVYTLLNTIYDGTKSIELFEIHVSNTIHNIDNCE